MLNNNNDFICYKYRISNYIYQTSFLFSLSLLFFSLNINNLTIFGQESDSEFSEHDDDINIVLLGIIIVMMKQKILSKILLLLSLN